MASKPKGRKRAQSTSSRVSVVSQAESASSFTGIADDKNLFKNKTLSLLSTDEPYYTPLGTTARPEKAEPVNLEVTLCICIQFICIVFNYCDYTNELVIQNTSLTYI